MLWLVGALALALLLGVAVVVWPLRFDVSGRAQGERDGSWVIAGGSSLGVAAVAFVWARGLPPQLSVLLFGKKIAWKPDWSRRIARPVPQRVKQASARFWSRLDPLELGLKLLDERRHVRLRYFVLDLSYGFRDPLLTGRLAGALSVLAAVLPAPLEIRQNPRWDLEDGFEIALDARAVLRPWLALLDILVYVVRQLSHERHQDRRSRPEPPAGGSGDLEERDDHRRAPTSR